MIQKRILCKVALTALIAIQAMAGTAQTPYKLNKDVAAVQLRTNGIYDLLASPNIGIEIQTDLGLAWELDYTGAWWNSYTRNRFWSNYIFQTELRYYLDHKHQDTPYFGHHVGVYGQMATYDFEFGESGKLCRDLDKTYAFGISYGYTLPLSRNFSLDLTLGLGYFDTKYDVYEPYQYGYKRKETRQMKWYGPTKVEASFVWNINAKNVFK
jgi:hypothetical protein